MHGRIGSYAVHIPEDYDGLMDFMQGCFFQLEVNSDGRQYYIVTPNGRVRITEATLKQINHTLRRHENGY